MYRSVVPPFSEKKTITCCDIDAFLQETWPFFTLGYFHLHMLFRFRCGTRQTCLMTIIFC